MQEAIIFTGAPASLGFRRLAPVLVGAASPGSGVVVRISENAKKSVLFFGVPSKKGIEYGGTGFLCAFRDEGTHFLYLATARHVAKGLEQFEDTGFYIRANVVSGGDAVDIPVRHIVWCHHPDPSVDLSVVPFGLNAKIFDHTHFSLSDVGPSFNDANAICCGDVVSLVGLFRLRAGAKRNMPIVHTGHIASLADPKELVPVRDSLTKKIIQSEVHLVEAQTLSGLSGSPVFFHEVTSFDIMEIGRRADGTFLHPKGFGGVDFLGIYTGAWDGEPGEILEADRNLRGGQRVPVGMGTVIPARKLIELMESDSMKKQRKKILDDRAQKNAATTDSSFSDPPATDASPSHREDFNSLLRAAVQKPEQAD